MGLTSPNNAKDLIQKKPIILAKIWYIVDTLKVKLYKTELKITTFKKKIWIEGREMRLRHRILTELFYLKNLSEKNQ